MQWSSRPSSNRLDKHFNSIPIMAQNKAIFAELDARLDVSEAQAEWCDHCNEGHPAPLD